jgi:hypothetical protein
LAPLASQARERLIAFPRLIDPDAVHMRNAVVHRRVEYLPKSLSVKLTEQRNPISPAPTDWTLTLTLTAFERRLHELWHAAGPVMRRLLPIAGTDFALGSGLVDAMPTVRALLQGDAAAGAALERLDLDGLAKRELVRAKPPVDAAFWFLPARLLDRRASRAPEAAGAPIA